MGVSMRGFVFGAIAVAALAVPAWAAHKDSATLTFSDPTTIGSKTLTPGNYEIRAEENTNQLEVYQDGKLLTEVPCHWYQLGAKANDTEVLIDGNAVQEVHFAGRTDAVKIQSGSSNSGGSQ